MSITMATRQPKLQFSRSHGKIHPARSTLLSTRCCKDIFEAFDDLGFCAKDPLIIDRLYTLSDKYGMNETQLAWKYVEFAHSAL